MFQRRLPIKFGTVFTSDLDHVPVTVGSESGDTVFLEYLIYKIKEAQQKDHTFFSLRASRTHPSAIVLPGRAYDRLLPIQASLQNNSTPIPVGLSQLLQHSPYSTSDSKESTACEERVLFSSSSLVSHTGDTLDRSFPTLYLHPLRRIYLLHQVLKLISVKSSFDFSTLPRMVVALLHLSCSSASVPLREAALKKSFGGRILELLLRYSRIVPLGLLPFTSGQLLQKGGDGSDSKRSHRRVEQQQQQQQVQPPLLPRLDDSKLVSPTPAQTVFMVVCLALEEITTYDLDGRYIDPFISNVFATFKYIIKNQHFSSSTNRLSSESSDRAGSSLVGFQSVVDDIVGSVAQLKRTGEVEFYLSKFSREYDALFRSVIPKLGRLVGHTTQWTPEMKEMAQFYTHWETKITSQSMLRYNTSSIQWKRYSITYATSIQEIANEFIYYGYYEKATETLQLTGRSASEQEFIGLSIKGIDPLTVKESLRASDISDRSFLLVPIYVPVPELKGQHLLCTMVVIQRRCWLLHQYYSAFKYLNASTRALNASSTSRRSQVIVKSSAQIDAKRNDCHWTTFSFTPHLVSLYLHNTKSSRWCCVNILRQWLSLDPISSVSSYPDFVDEFLVKLFDMDITLVRPENYPSLVTTRAAMNVILSFCSNTDSIHIRRDYEHKATGITTREFILPSGNPRFVDDSGLVSSEWLVVMKVVERWFTLQEKATSDKGFSELLTIIQEGFEVHQVVGVNFHFVDEGTEFLHEAKTTLKQKQNSRLFTTAFRESSHKTSRCSATCTNTTLKFFQFFFEVAEDITHRITPIESQANPYYYSWKNMLLADESGLFALPDLPHQVSWFQEARHDENTVVGGIYHGHCNHTFSMPIGMRSSFECGPCFIHLDDCFFGLDNSVCSGELDYNWRFDYYQHSLGTSLSLLLKTLQVPQSTTATTSNKTRTPSSSTPSSSSSSSLSSLSSSSSSRDNLRTSTHSNKRGKSTIDTIATTTTARSTSNKSARRH